MTSQKTKDSRRSPRFEVNDTGYLILESQDTGVDCRIVNRSNEGVKVELARELPIADSGKLYMPDSDCYMPARKVWQAENAVGLQFNIDPQNEDQS